jgi:hypothetical protein
MSLVAFVFHVPRAPPPMLPPSGGGGGEGVAIGGGARRLSTREQRWQGQGRAVLQGLTAALVSLAVWGASLTFGELPARFPSGGDQCVRNVYLTAVLSSSITLAASAGVVLYQAGGMACAWCRGGRGGALQEPSWSKVPEIAQGPHSRASGKE